MSQDHTAYLSRQIAPEGEQLHLADRPGLDVDLDVELLEANRSTAAPRR